MSVFRRKNIQKNKSLAYIALKDDQSGPKKNKTPRI
jgi:hypothetical protein